MNTSRRMIDLSHGNNIRPTEPATPTVTRRILSQRFESIIRPYLYNVSESKSFQIFMFTIILANTTCIGLETDPHISHTYGWYLSMFDILFVSAYIVEFVLKICALHTAYFYESWNIFDFFIVVTSMIDILWPIVISNAELRTSHITQMIRLFKVLKTIRALRVIRTIQFLENLQVTVNAIVQSLPALGSIVFLISLVLYIFAVVGKGLYQEVDPRRFGSIGKIHLYLSLTYI